MTNNQEVNINGTLIWYYYICPREVWLMARQITPDQDDQNIDLGRFIHEHAYQRDKKEVAFGHTKFDLVRSENGQVIVGEVKKTSKYRQSATMQLAYYLYQLRQAGMEATGELMFPKEKKKVAVVLDEETEAELEAAQKEILKIIYRDKPPQAKKIGFCRNCAYAEFCWA